MYTHIDAHTHMHTHTHTHTHSLSRVHPYACTHVCTCVCIHVCMYVCMAGICFSVLLGATTHLKFHQNWYPTSAFVTKGLEWYSMIKITCTIDQEIIKEMWLVPPW